MSTKMGKKGEDTACEYLRNKGFTIKGRNYRFKRNEIDIIAQNANNTLVFIEVKAKSSTRFGYPEEAVDEKKAARIIEAAEQYIYENDWQGNIRFDVLAIDLSAQLEQVLHFEDAFH